MRKFLTIFNLFLVLLTGHCFSQPNARINQLKDDLANAGSDSERIVRWGNLADYYYINSLDSLGDQALSNQLLLAELSNKENLMYIALFGDAITKITSSSSNDNFNNTVSFIEKGINYSEEKNNPDFIALGNNRMSQVYLKRGEADKGLEYSTKAVASLINVHSDSIKSLIFIGLGNAYLAKGNLVEACKNYNNAFDLALKANSSRLQSLTYHSLSELYLKLEYPDLAREEIYKSLQLNQAKNDSLGLIWDYIDLARLTDKKIFIERAILLSTNFKQYNYLLTSKRLMFYYFSFVQKDPEKSIRYLESEPDLEQSFINSGLENYYRAKGNVYFSRMPDSALKYYTLANAGFIKNSDIKNLRINYHQIAECFNMLGDYPKAIDYYLKTLNLNNGYEDFSFSGEISSKLSDLYQKENDYKKALHFANLSLAYKDSSSKLSGERDVALLGVARENKKHALELLTFQNSEINKRNSQFVFISIVIVIIFFAILALGSFTVPKYVLRFLGFLFFVSVFEFIVLLVDNLFIAHSISNEPLKLWGIKIALVALLVPLQHFLEKNVVRLLESRKLVRTRMNFSVKNFFVKRKKPSLEGFEADGIL
jgi:tetratricopeptide (TPR) repeat protein